MKSGDKFDLGSISISADEIKNFAAQYDPQPFHLDEEAAKQSLLGVLASSGWHSLTLCKKRMVDELFNTPNYGGSLQYGEVKWKRPVPADTPLALQVEVANSSPTSRLEGYGTLSFFGTLKDADGALAISFELDVAMKGLA